jgi:hypothetical protein
MPLINLPAGNRPSLEKKVLPKGMLTLPSSDSALNLRSASAGSATVSETENPCG